LEVTTVITSLQASMTARDGRADHDHDPAPLPGSCRQLDGSEADLTRPSHYPVEALCATCGQPIRCERWFRAPWRHVARFTLGPRDAERDEAEFWPAHDAALARRGIMPTTR
jgi:hypothetical protein